MPLQLGKMGSHSIRKIDRFGSEIVVRALHTRDLACMVVPDFGVCRLRGENACF